MSAGWAAAGGIVIAIFSWGCGWSIAHSTVSVECMRVGAFYVGDKVYKCQRAIP